MARSGAFTLLALWPLLSGGLDKPFYLGPRPPDPVRRVVTIAPSLTETVIALGASDRLVGVSRYDTLEEVKRLPRVGGFVDPSLEAVISLSPELVLVQPAPGNKQPVEKLAALGVPVLALPMHSIRSTEAAIHEVGRALDLEKRAAELVGEIEATRERVRKLARDRKAPKVLFVYGFSPLVVAGPGSFADELLADVGAKNAARKAGSPFTVYSVEAAVRDRPDVVVDAADTAKGKEALRELEGLREARWVKAPGEDLLHPGPRLARGVEALFALVHGVSATAAEPKR